jgi:hypothetical protein
MILPVIFENPRVSAIAGRSMAWLAAALRPGRITAPGRVWHNVVGLVTNNPPLPWDRGDQLQRRRR